MDEGDHSHANSNEIPKTLKVSHPSGSACGGRLSTCRARVGQTPSIRGSERLRMVGPVPAPGLRPTRGTPHGPKNPPVLMTPTRPSFATPGPTTGVRVRGKSRPSL